MTDEQPQPEETPPAAPAPMPAESQPAAPTGPSGQSPTGGFGGPGGPGGFGGPGAPSGPGGRPPMRRRRDFKGKYVPRRKVCVFCADKNAVIDYKDGGRMRRFLSDRGKIEPRRKTGTCAKHQRTLSTALKRARFIALLPYTSEHIRVMGGVPHARPVQ